MSYTKEARSAYYQMHKEQERETHKRWYLEHPNYRRDYDPKYRHRTGINKPMQEAKESPVYLGVYIAEMQIARRILDNIYDIIEPMPYGYEGFDLLCDGLKIDVKSASLRPRPNDHGVPRWSFATRKNPTPDIFLCIGFSNRNDPHLHPVRSWLIPGEPINNKSQLCITNSQRSLRKWEKYELLIEGLT